MAIHHVIKLLRLPPVPCRLCNTVLFLLIMCSLPSFSHAKSCESSGGSNLDLRDPSLAWRTVTYDRVDQGYLFRTDSGTLLLDTQTSIPQEDRRTLRSYKNTSVSKFPGLYLPWGYIWYGGIFRLSFNMSVYYEPDNQTPVSGSLVVAILPAYDFTDSPPPNQPMAIKLDSLSQNTSGSQMGSCKWPVYGVSSTGCVQIPIESTVECFIVYDPLGKRLSVSIGEAARNPDAPYAVASSMALDLSAMLVGDQIGQIGLFSSIGQLAQLQTWNLTVDRPLPKDGSQKWVIILSSVLGSVAATTVVAAAVYCYLNSKYRRWKKDLDQLAKTMQNLPGVPMQVDFAHINKATSNFHETMKLGRGGFGAVYGCTLPAAASRTGQAAMRVAVKKFTRELTDRRYEDFLAEVSIINRLRHKNVVPLVGWSYNKGEPLLIYEYMKNGSLDQHLFQSSSGFDQGRKQQDTAIGQWVTRYRIARDIAMGLQYLHHEHEPMVLHRDIKASNIMLDSDFCARLGDFGISCTVDAERSSVTGVAGTIGYMGPEYVVNYKATRQTDIFAFGVVILEIVTGKKNMHVPADDGHITQWVRRLHREGALLQALDDKLIPNTTNSETDFLIEEAQRLLLLGLACTNPNPSSRPSMTEVLQVINKLAPPPDVSLEQPSLGLGWISEDGSSSEYGLPATDHSSDSKTRLGQCSKEQRLAEDTSLFI